VRITVLVPDLAENGFGRAVVLAEVLARDHDVQVLGSCFGPEPWRAAADARLSVEWEPGRYWPLYAASVARLVRRIDGDVVYAVKPRFPSFGVALLARRLRGTPVVLDIDDDELAFRPPPTLRRPRSILSGVAHPDARFWTARAVGRIGSADALTVATPALRARHGGAVVPHVRDVERLRANPEERREARLQLGVGERPLVMFVGTPRPHKGLEEAAAAVRASRFHPLYAVVGAAPGDPLAARLAARYPETILHPPTTRAEGWRLLQAADAVILAQRDEPAASAQLPAKLIDAMALERPVIATAVADLPRILGDGRGYLVPAGDPAALVAALDAVLGDPGEAALRAARARAWCVAHASYATAGRTLAEVFGGLHP
jgi:glycosyltransferase involved in cell wall biosynthesis